MTTTTDISDTPTTFSLIGRQLLVEGQTMDLVARSPQMWVHAKIYAHGGENGVHTHPVEDHLFFVVGGGAVFVDALGNETIVERFTGILIPAGNPYAFKAIGDENLVMLRVGTSGDKHLVHKTTVIRGRSYPAPMVVRVNQDGTPSKEGDGKNGSGSGPGVPHPSSVFRS